MMMMMMMIIIIIILDVRPLNREGSQYQGECPIMSTNSDSLLNKLTHSIVEDWINLGKMKLNEPVR